MNLKLYLAIAALAFVGFGTANAQETEKKETIELTPEGEPVLKLEETEHDFGTIEQGEVVTHVFKFVNDGSAPLVISHISTPCGCTTPDWPKEPIAPGESSKITVKFNSHGKMGRQVKQLSIKYNSEQSPGMITIKGNVKPKSSTEE